MTAPLAFVDCETTGLDPERHEIWEVALLLDDAPDEYVWQLPVDLSKADPKALGVSGFYERYGRWQVADGVSRPELGHFAEQFAELTGGRHLVGAVPSFDAAFLTRLLRSNGACPGWHYHLVDVEALVAGKLGIAPPWNSNDLSRAVGVNPDDFERHTALGDACWAKAIYDAVMSKPTETTPWIGDPFSPSLSYSAPPSQWIVDSAPGPRPHETTATTDTVGRLPWDENNRKWFMRGWRIAQAVFDLRAKKGEAS